MMSNFRFASPEWSTALWAVLATVVVLVWLDRRRGDSLARLVAIAMQNRLVSQSKPARRILSILLIGLSAACFVIALMRPQYGLTYVKTPRVGAQIMFCLDVSKSMLAEDVAPSRLDRAKADITDMLSFLDGDQVGLIAFAGRASVLCPLTPDYGFFKLVLQGATPSSVGLGGTRLEEPIRKALDGFRSESDVSRIVFLITDGEDHDSHPVDVAKEAVERGIKIVAVGIGDEAGSELRITDPITGVQNRVVDGDGNPVVSRLDGETLREIALATEGVYIPAGTGSLDLRAIYDAHIRPLVRGEMDAKGRAIRQDAFQWAILIGLLFLFAGILVGSSRGDHVPRRESDAGRFVTSHPAASVGRLVLAAAMIACNGGPAVAETAETSPGAGTDPRELYNRAIHRMDTDLDAAERMLTEARQSARIDGEVRYRATYNLGWVEIKRADRVMEEDPEQTLRHLELAQGWFRDAVRLRKDADEARHNLEVVLLRILQLRDQLAAKSQEDLAALLDRNINTQRETIALLRPLVQTLASLDDLNAVDRFRSEFQELAVEQRVALSDLTDVVDQAAAELQSLRDKSEEERTAEDRIRIGQIEAVLRFVDSGRQRIGQSRSQLRRRQAARAFRRASSGLNQLKMARDQLRSPLERIDAILSDTTTLAGETAMMAMSGQTVPGKSDGFELPVWIDHEYLRDGQSDLATRTDDLTVTLQSGLENASTEPVDPADATTPEQAAPSRLVQQLDAAMPFLVAASDAMNRAKTDVDLEAYESAGRKQIDAIRALQEARERFADLRTLIELTHQSQSEIATALLETGDSFQSRSTESDDGEPVDSDMAAAVIEQVQQGQAKNLERLGRLENMIRDEIDRLTNSETPQGAPQPDEEQAKSELERYRFAATLVEEAAEAMRSVRSELERSGDENPAPENTPPENTPPNEPAPDNPASDATVPDETNDNTAEEEPEMDRPADQDDSVPDVIKTVRGAHPSADRALEKLVELRRLFFSLIEHLRETAERQATLNDDSEQQAGIAESQPETDAPSGQIRQLASRQTELQSVADRIADALQEQAAQTEEPAGQQLSPEQQQMMQDAAEKSLQAESLVSEASEQMGQAIEQLAKSPPQLGEARAPQDRALEKLVEALQLLQPPQQPPSQNQQPDQDQQNQEQQQQQQQQQQQAEQQQDGQMNPQRILQAVRDREAQRRKDQNRRQTIRQMPVEKDW